MKRFVYADNAATAKPEREAIQEMTRAAAEYWGNPSSLYEIGRKAKAQITFYREKTAQMLGCKPSELYFTSSGTESDNWAIKGAAYSNVKKGRHIISTAFEHHAVLHTLQALEKEGFEVTYLPVHEEGIIRLDELRDAMRPDTTLVCIMYANNEIGTIQPIKEAAAIAHEGKALFFTDAVQAVGHTSMDIAELGVDMLSFSGHKFGAPKGIGGLFIKDRVRIKNLIEGGGHERGKRSGTENLPYIAAMTKALEISLSRLDENEAIKAKRDRLIDSLLKLPYTRLNGDRDSRLVSNANISFESIEGEGLILLLDMAGICASTGSACSTASLDPSHVLLAIGLPHEIAHGSLRLTISHDTTDEDIDYIIENVERVVARLREMSPLWEKKKEIK